MTARRLMLAAGLAALAGPAFAHDAPAGWAYPALCCSDRDCRPVPDDAVRETAAGYVLARTGEVIGYRDGRVKASPDGMFHACQQGGDFDAGRVICLFVPPRAF